MVSNGFSQDITNGQNFNNKWVGGSGLGVVKKYFFVVDLISISNPFFFAFLVPL